MKSTFQKPVSFSCLIRCISIPSLQDHYQYFIYLKINMTEIPTHIFTYSTAQITTFHMPAFLNAYFMDFLQCNRLDV